MDYTPASRLDGTTPGSAATTATSATRSLRASTPATQLRDRIQAMEAELQVSRLACGRACNADVFPLHTRRLQPPSLAPITLGPCRCSYSHGLLQPLFAPALRRWAARRRLRVIPRARFTANPASPTTTHTLEGQAKGLEATSAGGSAAEASGGTCARLKRSPPAAPRPRPPARH